MRFLLYLFFVYYKAGASAVLDLVVLVVGALHALFIMALSYLHPIAQVLHCGKIVDGFCSTCGKANPKLAEYVWLVLHDGGTMNWLRWCKPHPVFYDSFQQFSKCPS